MTFNKLGGIYYNETTEVSVLGEGGNIPCFIGRTINPAKFEREAKAQLIAGGTAEPTNDAIKTLAGTLKTAELEKHRINELQIFQNFTQINRTALDDEGKLLGLGDYDTEKDDNPLLKFLYEFCDESKMMTEEYVSCPYFYVIDLGCADTLDQWINSIETSKLKREIDFEVYIGFDRVTDTKMTVETNDDVTANIVDFILAVNYDLVMNRQPIGDFRKAFYTIPLKVDTNPTIISGSSTVANPNFNKYYGNDYYRSTAKDQTTGKLKYQLIDEELIALAKSITTNNDTQFAIDSLTENYTGLISTGTTSTVSKSRTYLCEPLHFGRTIARITSTPYDMEPGYYEYNTLTIDDIILRKPSEQIKLQIAGVIFNHLEETSTEEFVKINRTQSVSSNLVNHPPDSLFQSRQLCDELMTRVFDAVYPQLKNKETETNIEYLRTQVNKIVSDAINDGDFIPPYTVENQRKGTFLNVQESTEDAYDIEVVGMIQPVNCTYTIHIIAQINDAKVQITEK